MNNTFKNAIIFVIGVLIGCAGTGIYIHHCFSRAWVNSGDHRHVVEVLDHELNLSPEQKAQVSKIFDEAAPSMETLRVETNAKLKAVRDNTSAKIRSILTADQQKKYDQLKAKWDAKMDSNNKGWHIPGLPPGPSSHGCGPTCSPVPGVPDKTVSK